MLRAARITKLLFAGTIISLIMMLLTPLGAFAPHLIKKFRVPKTEASQDIGMYTCMDVGQPKERHRPQLSDTDHCILYEQPATTDYIELFMHVLVGLPNAGRCNQDNGCQPPHSPYVDELRNFGDDWPPYGFTMVGMERLKNFQAAIQEVNRKNIKGAICEFGVWRGGGMMLAAAINERSAIRRDLYLFDAFGAFGGYGLNDRYLAVPLKDVKKNFRMLNLDPEQDNVHFVEGMFNETTASWVERSDPIAVLRVDGNFYESYQSVMYAVYENVPVGGIVIFDDVMSHQAVMRCWNDFKADHGLIEELVRIDTHSAWFRKKKNVKVDHSKKRDVPIPI